MTTGVRTAGDVAGVADAYDAYLAGLVYGGSPAELSTQPGAHPTPDTGVPARPAPVVYPKRSELRRAEARAGRRGDRRPPAGRLGGVGPHPGHPGQHQTPGRRARATEPHRPIPAQPAAWLPPRHSDDTNPSGLRLPPPVPSAFVPTPPVTPEVPVRGDTTGPLSRVVDVRGAGGPVTAMPDPAAWTDDEQAAPRRRGRRRGVEEARSKGRPRRPPTETTTVATPGRGTTSAAHLLVLALVVGFEGLAVTSLARMARTAPLPEGPDAERTAAGLSAATVLSEAPGGQRVAVAAPADAVTRAAAQVTTGSRKMADALREAQAAAARAKAAAERRERAMRNAQRDPKSVARLLVADRGWGSSQFTCLDKLWTKESRWNYRAENPSSGAYGIPQALPGSKMGSVAADWRTNPVTQITWGLNYIDGRYGTPCGAWGHSQSVGWY